MWNVKLQLINPKNLREERSDMYKTTFASLALHWIRAIQGNVWDTGVPRVCVGSFYPVMCPCWSSVWRIRTTIHLLLLQLKPESYRLLWSELPVRCASFLCDQEACQLPAAPVEKLFIFLIFDSLVKKSGYKGVRGWILCVVPGGSARCSEQGMWTTNTPSALCHSKVDWKRVSSA